MNGFLAQLQNFLELMRDNLPLTLIIISGVWFVYFFNKLFNNSFNILGIYPRHLLGLPGIIFSPFLHGNFNHLFFNSIPLLVLIDFILIDGLNTLICVSIIVIVLSGIAIWLFGRRGIHIGASSLVMGYFSFLLADAYRHPSISSVILAIICIYYFGGLLFDLFPREEKVSWEGHIFGFLAGLVAAFYGCVWT